jgi:GT2 family glycosyltransferase
MAASTPNPRASVLVPTWNGQEFLKVILPSLQEQVYRGFETVVVDNGSTDDSVAYLERHWPDVRVLALPTNVGFAAAVNRGAEIARAPVIVLANNDLEADPRWLEELVGPLDGDGNVGFTTGKLLRSGDRGVIDEAGHDVCVYGLTTPRGFGTPDSGQFDQPAETVVGTGGASAFRRSLWEELGGLDEDYFLFYEDVDLCLRARWRGYRGCYVPSAVVYHHGGGTAGRGSRSTRVHLTRNLLITVLKDFPLRLLTVGGWRIAFHQARLLRDSVRQGWLGPFLAGWTRFLLAIPRTLRKRRRVMARRKLSGREFAAALLTHYPHPGRFTRGAAR